MSEQIGSLQGRLYEVLNKIMEYLSLIHKLLINSININPQDSD